MLYKFYKTVHVIVAEVFLHPNWPEVRTNLSHQLRNSSTPNYQYFLVHNAMPFNPIKVKCYVIFYLQILFRLSVSSCKICLSKKGYGSSKMALGG